MLRPIFIGGCPRSGTTMLGAILGEARNCFTTPETIFKQTIMQNLTVLNQDVRTADAIRQAIDRELPFWKISIDTLAFPESINKNNARSVMETILEQYKIRENKADAEIWIDHTPPNILHGRVLEKFYPDAKFIHLVRDPRAVAASAMKLAWGPVSPREFGNWWTFHLAHGLAMERHFGERCLRVRYEDILTHPEDTLKRICRFCEIEFDPAILSAQSFQLPPHSTRQHQLVGKEPDNKRLYAWKTELHPLTAWRISFILREMIEFLDYDFAVSKPELNLAQRLHWALGEFLKQNLSPLKRKHLRMHRNLLRRYYRAKTKIGRTRYAGRLDSYEIPPCSQQTGAAGAPVEPEI